MNLVAQNFTKHQALDAEGVSLLNIRQRINFATGAVEPLIAIFADIANGLTMGEAGDRLHAWYASQMMDPHGSFTVPGQEDIKMRILEDLHGECVTILHEAMSEDNFMLSGLDADLSDLAELPRVPLSLIELHTALGPVDKKGEVYSHLYGEGAAMYLSAHVVESENSESGFRVEVNFLKV